MTLVQDALEDERAAGHTPDALVQEWAALVWRFAEASRGRARSLVEQTANLPPPLKFIALMDSSRRQQTEAPAQVVQLATDRRITKRVFKTTRHRSLAAANTETERNEIEKQERSRWVKALAELIFEAGLPIAEQISTSPKPDLLWEQVGGRGRAGTIRGHVRVWERVRQWLLASTGHPWPASPSVLAEYLGDVVEAGCPKSLPKSLDASLSFLERAGAVKEADAIHEARIWRNAVDSAVLAASAG